MILVDLQQLLYANIMVMNYKEKNTIIDEPMIRHMILNSIRSINRQFRDEYGEMIIACDNRQRYWRRDVFPYYKAHRKEVRDKSNIDWDMVHKAISSIITEIHDNFQYRVINVEGAEADDVIGTLCMKYGDDMLNPIVIVSRDHDFFQLHKYLNVRQYNWIDRKFINCNDPEGVLNEHIIGGDSGDGIPNILCADNTFVLKIRQKPMTTARMEAYIKQDWKEAPEEIARNYKRNRQLIDFKYIPDKIRNGIIESFDSQTNKKRNVLNYFIKYKLKNLTETINDF